MSTPAITPRKLAQGAVQERPRQYLTGIIESLGDPKTTQQGDGDYDAIDIVFKPTNGSRKLFPKLLLREEWLAPGFDPKMYLDYNKYPALRTVPEGKSKTKGEILGIVYAMNVQSKQVTNLMAICGGTQAGLDGFIALYDQALSTVPDRTAGDFGLVCLTMEETVALLRKYLSSRQPTDLLCIGKQGKDQNGELKDGYELASWIGPLSKETHKAAVERVAKSATKKGADKVILGYQV